MGDIWSFLYHLLQYSYSLLPLRELVTYVLFHSPDILAVGPGTIVRVMPPVRARGSSSSLSLTYVSITGSYHLYQVYTPWGLPMPYLSSVGICCISPVYCLGVRVLYWSSHSLQDSHWEIIVYCGISQVFPRYSCR